MDIMETIRARYSEISSVQKRIADYCLEHSDGLDELAHTSTAWAGYPDDWAAASDELMDELLGVLL